MSSFRLQLSSSTEKTQITSTVKWSRMGFLTYKPIHLQHACGKAAPPLPLLLRELLWCHAA